MTVTEQSEIARYVEAVRAALADLPPAARDELLEELPEHLAEVAAETDGPLADRLGPPEAYAAELRAAAGIAPPDAPARDLDARIAALVARLRRRARAVDVKAGPLIGYATASEYLRLLRPAWWVLRGYLVALFVSEISGGHSGLLPRLGDSGLAGLLLLVACVLGSIWLGRRTGRLTRWPRYALTVGTVFLAFFALVALAQVDGRARSGGYYTPSFNDNPYSHVQDVYVYDGEGRLVENARLFDQNGEPIRLGYPWCPEADMGAFDKMRHPGYPYCPAQAPFRVGGAAPTATAPAVPPAAPGPPSVPVAPSATPAPSGSPTPAATPTPSATG
ncbi:Uncharacterized membrane protein [Micromonospora pattaloongensis]|uniref:Uncharacterized membrane protein n=1 Tax=Micromonospora pattaloongensis TaxID=405436 RepID=A0A1H3MAY5_9ACTN|nr:hypothetical protein [Micromonospora pattaloongensis]SDY73753.1 Uncharacterized membrane protein [Micromonospora pattaloongensis]